MQSLQEKESRQEQQQVEEVVEEPQPDLKQQLESLSELQIPEHVQSKLNEQQSQLEQLQDLVKGLQEQKTEEVPAPPPNTANQWQSGVDTMFSGDGDLFPQSDFVSPLTGWRKIEKYFGYLARCEAKFCTTTLKF